MNDEKLETICQHYGIRKQLKKLSEEVFELQEAVIDADQEWHISTDDPMVNISKPFIQHIAKNQGNIAEELADVMVLWEQIRLHYGIPSQTIAAITTEKINRQLKRIEDEKGR
jgi:NTP pyrophosphatase (non-canonical NTP hydrolase)